MMPIQARSFLMTCAPSCRLAAASRQPLGSGLSMRIDRPPLARPSRELFPGHGVPEVDTRWLAALIRAASHVDYLTSSWTSS